MDKKEFLFGSTKPEISWQEHLAAIDKGHTNFIILMVFCGILFLSICGGLGMYIAGEKGRSTKMGFLIGMIPFIGHIALGFMSQSDENVVDEMFKRKLISLNDYEKTSEVLVGRTQEMKLEKDGNKNSALK